MNSEYLSFSEVIKKYKGLFGFIHALPGNPRFLALLSKTPFFLLLLAIAYYIYNFSLISILTQAIFGTGTHDVGVYDQVIWLMSRFMAPYSTLGGINLFGIHVSFNCVLLVPLFWIWPNINMLYIAQSVFLGLTAIPLFLYANEKLKNPFLALSVGVSYLLYPAMQNMNLENFHPEVIIIFFLAWAVYFMLIENFHLFYPFLILAAMGKEEMGVVVFFIGLYLLFFKRQSRHGTITSVFGVVWYLACSRIIMPLANGINPLSSSQPLVFSHWFGAFANNLFNPAYYWASIFNPESMRYLLDLFYPVLFIPLLAPSTLFMAVPALAINILSGVGYFRSIFYHYNYVVICFIYFALIEALSRIKFNRRILKSSGIVITGLALILSALVANERQSRFPLRRQRQVIAELREQANSKSVKGKKEALRVIPDDANISVSYSLWPQLSHRKEIYLFPSPFGNTYWTPGVPRPSNTLKHVEYIAIEWGNHGGEEERAIIRFLLNSSYYREIYWQGSLLIMKRQGDRRDAGFGANYILYDFEKRLPVTADFNKELEVKQKGVLSCIYFPESSFEFRNLLGEEIPVSNPMALQIFGYLFVPDNGEYRFDLQSGARSLLLIDGKIVREAINLKRGFHAYKINHINNTGRIYGLKVWVRPVRGKPYIISDRDLMLRKDPALFNRYLSEDEKKRKKKEAFNLRQSNNVLNNGFEIAYGNQPQDWQLESWRDEAALCSFELVSAVKQKGKYSAKLEHNGLADSRWVQEIELSPNTHYKLSGWIKTVGIPRKGEGAYIFVEGTELRTEVLFGTNDWKYVEVSGKTGADQKLVKLQCRLGNYGAPNFGTAYFDQIELKEILPHYGF